MTWEQQRAQILATIKSKKGKIGGIMTKAANEKRSPSDDEEVQIKAVEDEIARLDVNLARINDFIADVAAAAENATPVAGQSEEEAGNSAEGDPNPDGDSKRVTVTQNLDEGIGFAKAMRARVTAQLERRKGSNVTALDVAKARNEPEQVIRFLQKDALIGTTTTPGMMALTDNENLDGEFIDLLRQRTVFDKLKGFREVPFNIKMANQLTGGLAQWVGEGAAKPVTNATFGSVKIDEHKIAAIAIFTDEFLRNSKPKADAIFLEDLIAACAQ